MERNGKNKTEDHQDCMRTEPTGQIPSTPLSTYSAEKNHLRKSFSEIFSLNDHFQPRVRNILWNLYLGRARSENTFKSQAISFLIVAGKMFSGKKGAT